MDRVRSIARVSREGDEAKVTETTPISEVMRRSSLDVPEEATVEGASNAEVEQVVVEGESDNESEEDNNILSPSKPSHIEFGKSTVTTEAILGKLKINFFALLEKK